MIAGALIALAVTAGAPSPGAMLFSALAPAPDKVVLETRSFGTVVVDHRAHLARRAACKTCHGPGPVAKLGRLEPKVAHDRCIGCHRTQERGPTSCRECHAVPAVAPAAAAPGQKLAMAAAEPPAPAAAPTPPSIDTSSRFAQPRFAEEAPRSLFTRTFSLGYSALPGSPPYVASGPSLQLLARDGDVVMLYAIERMSAAGQTRTLGLLGAGLSRPIAGPFQATGLVVGGIDVGEGHSISAAPNAGLRAGVEWLGRRTTFALFAAGGCDLLALQPQPGAPTSRVTFSLIASVGLSLPHSP